MKKKKNDLITKIDSAIKIVFGIVLLIIGITGLLLPILPGWLFIILGISFLGSKRIKKLFQKIKK